MKVLKLRPRLAAEIDITPFTDVVLVLLIIFMITTPMIVKSEAEKAQKCPDAGFAVDLPKAQGSPFKMQKSEIVVALLEDGRIVVKNEAIDETGLKAALSELAADPEAEIIIQADRLVPHYRVVQIMDLAGQYGLTKLSIATQKEAP